MSDSGRWAHTRNAGGGGRAGVGRCCLASPLRLRSNCSAGTQPLLIAGLLYLGSGIGVSALRLIQDRGWSATGLKAGDWPWLALTTLVGGIIAPALLMLGLARADAADASLLLNLEVVFTAVLAWLVFKEPANSRVVLGLVAILAGGLILVWPARFATERSLPALSLDCRGLPVLGTGQQPDA